MERKEGSSATSASRRKVRKAQGRRRVLHQSALRFCGCCCTTQSCPRDLQGLTRARDASETKVGAIGRRRTAPRPRLVSRLPSTMLRVAARRALVPRAALSARLQSTLPKPDAATPLPPPTAPAGNAPPLPPPGPQPAAPQPSPTVAESVPAPAPASPSSRSSGPGAGKRLKSLLVSSALFLGTGAFLAYAYDSRAGVHRCALAGPPQS